jgi:hypothetical protein
VTEPLDLDATMAELTALVDAMRARGDALGLGSLTPHDLMDEIERLRASIQRVRDALDSTIGLAQYLKAHQAEGPEGRDARDVAERILGSLQKSLAALDAGESPVPEATER